MDDEATGNEEPAPEGEASNTERDEELESLRGKIAAYEKREADRAKADRDRRAATRRKEHDAAKSRGELDKLLKMAHEDRDEAMGERDALRAELDAFRSKERSRTLARAVAKKAGGGNIDALALMIPNLGLTLEDNPGKELISAAMTELTSIAPTLLGAPTQHPNGRPPLRPGITVSPGEQGPANINSPEYWKAQGRLASEKTGMPAGYDEMTGRARKQ